MGYIVGGNRGQITLLPDSIDDYITEDSPARVIDVFIENLDLGKAGFKRATPAIEGRPSYNPRDLLKLYIYGYFNKIRSSRKLMKECQRNIEVMWLIKKLTPDFRTIADFRKDNARVMKNIFKAFVKLCLEMDLYQKELIAIDGSKFRAVNSRNRNFTDSQLKEHLERIENDISKFIEEFEKYDREEENIATHTKEELQNKIDELTLKKDKYNRYLEEMKENKDTQKSLTDPESRLMKNNGKFDVCFNVQTTVDSGSHLIAEFLVTDHCNDLGLLTTVAEDTKKCLR